MRKVSSPRPLLAIMEIILPISILQPWNYYFSALRPARQPKREMFQHLHCTRKIPSNGI
jgi:hypothetical protein